MSRNGAEQRNSSRVPLDAPVSYTLDNRNWHESRSRDISVGGLFLQGKISTSPGQFLRLSFPLPDISWQGEIDLQAEVVRISSGQDNTPGIGLKFVTLQSSSREVLTEFVRQVLGVPMAEEISRSTIIRRDGIYTFDMDRLIEKSLERESMMVEEIHLGRMKSSPAPVKKFSFKSGLKTALAIFLLLLFFLIARYALNLIFPL